MRYPVVVALLLLFDSCGSISYARTWYVLPDSTGDAPTIQAAIDSSSAGDSVLVAAGFYYVNLGIDHLSNFALVSESGPEITILDGDPTYNPQRRQVINVTSSSNVVVNGFTIQNGRPGVLASDAGGGVRIAGNGPVFVTNNIIQANRNELGAAIGFSYPCNGCEGSRIENNQILNNISNGKCGGVYGAPAVGPIYVVGNYFEGNEGEYAAAWFEWINCFIQNNECTGNTSQKYCISTEDGGQSLVEHNLLYGNEGGGIAVDNGIDRNNTVIGHSYYGIAVLNGQGYNNLSVGNWRGIGCYQSSMYCNNSYGSTDMDWESASSDCDTVGMAGNILADPLFCSPGIGDYSIASESPCAPANSGGCGLIGALDVGCTITSVPVGRNESVSWGGIKRLFR